jgi:serine/threonine protein kinase
VFCTNKKQPSDPQLANTFVLKQYHGPDAERYYTNESKAFARLKRRGVPNIIEFFGSFIHGRSHNLLLEFADQGNLEDYFHNIQPPSRVEDITNFWTQLFHLINALVGMHNVQIDDAGGSHIFQG